MGSVFSPTYFRARARQLEPEPEDFCALNVAIYREGRKHWAFTEHPRPRVRRSHDRFDLGSSYVAWEDDELIVGIDERTAGLGMPMRGTVRVRPHHRFDRAMPLDPAERHHWWPVAPLCEIEVALDRPSLAFRGSGYHDTNFGREPLERGFSTWDWSRAELPEGTAVLYDARPREGEPSERGLLYRHDGRLDTLEAAARYGLPRTGWGIDRATRADEGVAPRVERTLESTPFYARSLLKTMLCGHTVTAVHESVSLDRFAHPVVQRMLPFRIRRGWRA
ncbi:MAG: carotenoid 1,2-hydratase [Myxococcota bacterium]